LILTTSFLVRIAWIGLVPASPVSDFAWYHQRGLEIAAGKGYQVNGTPTAYWPIGYPAFLGLIFRVFGPSLTAAKLANVFLYMGVLLLSYRLASYLFRSDVVGRLTVLFLSFYPNHIAYSSLLSCETLFLFLLLLGVWLLVTSRERPAAVSLSGAVLGLACLVKPQALFVPAVILAGSHFLSGKRPDLRHFFSVLVLCYVFVGAVISPWIVRNYAVFGSMVFVSNNGGVTLFIGNNPYANGTYIPLDKVAYLLPTGLDERGLDIAARRYALRYIATNPWRTVVLWPTKIFFLFNGDVEGAEWNMMGLGKKGPLTGFFWYFVGASQNYYRLTLVLFTCSVLFFHLRKRTGEYRFPTLGLLIIGYFSLLYMLMIGISRFHFPFIPWMMMYVASAVDGLTSQEASEGR